MTTTAEIVPILCIFGSSCTRLGRKAAVVLSLGDKEVYCDEVKLWQASSRESFIKGCLKVLEQQRGRKIKKGERKNISEKFDKWLREEKSDIINFGDE